MKVVKHCRLHRSHGNSWLNRRATPAGKVFSQFGRSAVELRRT
jgi:hypothetical protein